MSEVSFPGDGQDGEQPPPGVPARDETPAMPSAGPQDAGANDRPAGHADTPEDGHPNDHGDRPAGPWLPGASATPDDDWDPEAEQAPPADPARDETPAVPADDWDGDAEMAAYFADLDAGRRRIPEEWEIESRPPVTISLGDAADVDPAELAAMLGPDGLGGEIFAQDRPAAALRPGPLLAALTERAAGDPARLGDNELLGAVAAARRLAARAEYLELTAVAEFTRRREAQLQAATAAGVPPGQRDGEFAGAELGMELVTSGNAARDTMDMATDLETRLPKTREALAAGVIDGYRARLIWKPTRCLSDDDAAYADALLAPLAPHLRYDQLARKAAATAMKLDPEACQRGKEQARADRQRVAAGREESGNAYLSGRELAVEDALAGKAHIDALAVTLRRGGLPGTLQRLRVLAFTDLTQGRDPLDRLTSPHPANAGPGDHPGEDRPAPGDEPHGDADADGDDPDPGDGDDDQSWDGYPDLADWQHERRGHRAGDNCDDGDRDGGGGVPAGPPAPFPALINLTIPAGTAFGWGTAPGEAGSWGLLDPDDTRRLTQAASRHPGTRWCITLLAPDGTAAAHGCARGPPPPTPPPPGRPGSIGPPGTPGTRDCPAAPGNTHTPENAAAPPGNGPDARQAAALADLLRRLNVTFTPIAKGSCDHRNAEDRYRPSRKLGHLARARTATCPAPGCGAQAHHNDLDHTVAYPAGRTCECNIGPPCRRHHRCKQAPGWTLEQPEPGVFRWTTPSGRVYTTRPTIYET